MKHRDKNPLTAYPLSTNLKRILEFEGKSAVRGVFTGSASPPFGYTLIRENNDDAQEETPEIDRDQEAHEEFDG
jgi:hypothetical protein